MFLTQTSIEQEVKIALSEALERAKERGVLNITSIPKPAVELPKREEWGDLSSNLAMVLGPQVGRPPLEVAGVIAKELQEDTLGLFARIDIAPPGFLNFTINPTRWVQVLSDIEEKGHAYGTSQIGKGQRVLVEFVSANPTGPLHVGHGRGAALGQAISNLLRTIGYTVQREYYVNDAGRQLKLLGSSVFARYREHFGQSVSFPEDGYHGTYIRTVAEEIAQEANAALLDLPTEEAEQRCMDAAYTKLLEKIRIDLEHFGVGFDSWYSEAKLHNSGCLEQTLERLKTEDFVVQKEGAWWFRSSQFQDEKDRVVVKQDGEYTYLASDIAYHREKLERGYDTLINIWGADHHGYIPRIQAAVEAFGYSKERLRIVLVQMVSLLRGGSKVEMSKRAGEFVTLREVMDEVGADAAKFFFLMRRSDSHLEFDLDLAKQQSAENPVYYVQYAHARLASLFRVAGERGIPLPSTEGVDAPLLVGPDEVRLIKHLSYFPALVEGSATSLEPHRVTFYLQNLAGHLHTYYYKHRVLPAVTGQNQEDEKHDPQSFISGDAKDQGHNINEDDQLTSAQTAARLVLMGHVQTVIRNGLSLLGIAAPERM